MRLSKRQKIIVACTIITIGLISTQLINIFFLRYRFIFGLGLLAYLVSLWVLWEGITRQKAVVLMILPTMFAVAVASFYFLLPVRWLTRLPVAAIFFVSFYVLLLSQNVFNVAAQRTIPLYRAASTVAFLFTLITAFFLFNVIFALQLPFYWNGLAVFLISLPLVMQMLWLLEMERVNNVVIIYSLLIALVAGESAIALSFWPAAPTVWSLFLSTILYVVLGIVLEHMRDRLTRRICIEYIAIGGLVFVLSSLATVWGV